MEREGGKNRGSYFVPPNYQDWHNCHWSDSRCGSEAKLRQKKQKRHQETTFDTKVVSYDAFDKSGQWLLGDKKHFEQHCLNSAFLSYKRKAKKEWRKTHPKVCKPFNKSLVTKWL